MAKRPSFVLNFRFKGNAQTLKGTRSTGVNQARDARGRFTAIDNFARVVVEDVALNSSNRTYNAAKASLEAGVKSAVAKEISRMAAMIAKFVVQPNGARGPKGIVYAANTQVSRQAASLWGKGSNIISYDLAKSDVKWNPRSKDYMGWKRKQNYPEDWWSMKGSLRKALANESLYQDLGPVSVSFVKGGNEPKGGAMQTSSGRKGNVSSTYQIGQLNVAVFGRITPDMLPSMMDTFSGGVGEVTPHGGGNYIPSLFKDKEVRDKLSGRGEYRPVVEPFISYYLTRAIPNAVFARTEKLITDAISVAGANRLGGGFKGVDNMDSYSIR